MNRKLWRKIIAYTVTIMMLLSLVPAGASNYEQTFVDFPTGWSREAVTSGVANGLLNGRTPTTLEPQGNLTRAEMAAIINRAFGSTIEANISAFWDVSPSAWYYHDIAKAVNMQVLQGDASGTMRPDDFITRQEVMAVIARALVLEDTDFSVLNKFNDNSLVSDWAKPYASILVKKGYINGNDLGNISPLDNITREEFAQMMHNIFKKYYVLSGTVKDETINDCALIRTPGVTLRNVNIEGDLVLGDGVGRGDVTLINVKIGGRLLCRGGEGKVWLTKTTVGEKVVVKDVNGTVNFNNYKSEKVFKNILMLTPATFLTASGGGYGSGATYHTVYFHEGANPESFTSKQISSNKNTLKLSGISLEDVYDGKMYTLGEYKWKTYSHNPNPDFWYDNGTSWVAFTEDTLIDKDVHVYYGQKHFMANYNPISVDVVYDSKSRLAQTYIDALIAARNSIINANNMTGVIDDIEYKIFSTLYNKTGLVSKEGYLLSKEVGLKIIDVIKYDEIVKEIDNYVEDKLRGTDDEIIDIVTFIGVDNILSIIDENHVLDVNDIIEHIHTIKAQGKFNEFCAEVHKHIGDSKVYNDFMKCFKNENEFYEVNKDNYHFVKAVGEAVYEFEFDEIMKLLEARGFSKLIDLLGREILQEMFVDATNDYYFGMLPILEDIENGTIEKANYKASLTVKVNAYKVIESVYNKGYNGIKEKVKNTNKYHYYENDALRELIETNWFDKLVGFDQNLVDKQKGITGYYIKGIIEYYEIMLDTVVLIDQAITWYGDSPYFDDVKIELSSDISKIYDKICELAQKIKDGEEIAKGYTLEDVIEKVESLASSGALSSIGGIKPIVDNLCEILENLSKGEKVYGYTIDDMLDIASTIKDIVKNMEQNEYEEANLKLSSLIKDTMDKMADFTLGEDSSLDKLMSNLGPISDYYAKYASQIKSIVETITSLEVEVDSERIEDIIFGKEDIDNVFTIDYVLNYVASNASKFNIDYKVGKYNEGIYVIDTFISNIRSRQLKIQREFY